MSHALSRDTSSFYRQGSEPPSGEGTGSDAARLPDPQEEECATPHSELVPLMGSGSMLG